MSSLRGSLINPIYNSALFDSVFLSQGLSMFVPMSLLNFFTADEICSPDMSATKKQEHQLLWQTA